MAGLRTADRETSPIRNSAKNEKRVASTPPRRLLRHVEQAVAAAVASPMRKVRRTRRDGTAATKLLGDEHGSMWDLMDWVNVVLGKNEITKATKSPHRKLSRLVWERLASAVDRSKDSTVRVQHTVSVRHYCNFFCSFTAGLLLDCL